MDSDTEFKIEILSRTHDRANFDCGETGLNDFLQKHAKQNATKGLSVTYVAVGQDSKTILAYYSISSGQVACAALPEEERLRLPRYPIPVIRIGKLETDLKFQCKGIGRIMLVDALSKAAFLSTELGVYAVEVDALTPKAKEFYCKLGFSQLADNQLHLYISIRTINKLFL
jgi:GNAT superfamily N-acetyltransferase